MSEQPSQISTDWPALNAESDEMFRRTVIDNPWIPWKPHAKQIAFLTCPLEECLFGGAAGGAKTVAILMAAAQFVEHGNYNALLCRKTLPMLELPGGLISLSKSWWTNTDAEWSEQKKCWRFPSGALIQFGYLDVENDMYRYQGSEWDFFGADELTQLPELMYLYLFSRLRRRIDSMIPPRVRCTANPGGIGHEWVKERFIENRIGHFIPSKLEDNPSLDRVEYEGKLQKLDAVTRAQLRNGDWHVRPDGNLFKRAWFEKKIVEIGEVPEMVQTVRFWDLAATEEAEGKDPDFTAGVKMGLDRFGNFYIFDSEEFRMTPAQGDERIKRIAQNDGHGTEIAIEQEPGSSGKRVIDHFVRTVLRGFSVRGIRSTGDKITRAKPFSAACENGLVFLVRGNWIANFIDRCMSFGIKGTHDDTVDAAAGAHRQLTQDEAAWTPEEMEEVFNGPSYDLDTHTLRPNGFTDSEI